MWRTSTTNITTHPAICKVLTSISSYVFGSNPCGIPPRSDSALFSPSPASRSVCACQSVKALSHTVCGDLCTCMGAVVGFSISSCPFCNTHYLVVPALNPSSRRARRRLHSTPGPRVPKLVPVVPSCKRVIKSCSMCVLY